MGSVHVSTEGPSTQKLYTWPSLLAKTLQFMGGKKRKEKKFTSLILLEIPEGSFEAESGLLLNHSLYIYEIGSQDFLANVGLSVRFQLVLSQAAVLNLLCIIISCVCVCVCM